MLRLWVRVLAVLVQRPSFPVDRWVDRTAVDGHW